MVTSSMLTSVGAGLLTTFDLDTGSRKWTGYQLICGFGIDLGLQLPLVAIQTVLNTSEIASATALIRSVQIFGTAIFGSVGQSVLGYPRCGCHGGCRDGCD